jgi:molybdate transport system substrate-binding protein
MHKRILTFIIWAFFSLLLVVGCNQAVNNQNSSPSSPALNSAAPSTKLTISAAASLKDAMEEIKPLYSKEKSNVTLTYNFGSSGALQQQIEQGAPADVFISAAAKQMDALQQKSLLLDGTRKDLLRNQVVLIVPEKGTAITGFKDLTSDRIKKIAIGEPKSVPAGKYAQEVLTKQKIFDPIKAKVVYAKDVRQVLNYVESGNADAGIVYLSDAKSSNKVKVVETAPENSHSPVVYPLAVLKSSKNPDAAKDFVQFLFGNQAKTVFEKQGFTMAAQ